MYTGFVSGDGSKTNPYIICNELELQRVATDVSLLDKSYQLGKDLNFDIYYGSNPFTIIGSELTPFTGTFDGNGYTMASIRLDSNSSQYIAPFAYVKNGKIENLFVSGVTTSRNGSQYLGGLVGRAENTTLINVHVTGLNMNAPDRSGGLVGSLEDSLVLNSSTEGVLTHHFGTDNSGGLVGVASNSDISGCSSHVLQQTSSGSPSGVSGIGGLVGGLINSRARDVYAVGNIDYGTTDASHVTAVGGIVGSMTNSLLVRAYYAGKIVMENAQEKGGAVGKMSSSSIAESVFWDKQVSGVSVSAAGSGEDTQTLKKKSFWVSHDFDQHLWRLIRNQYPRLFGADGVE